MFRAMTKTLVATAAVAAAACASTSFNSTWKNPAAEPGNFKGKKVAALVVSKEEGVRYGAEDALARELTARGAVGIAAYSLIPKELIQDKDKAKEFLEKADVVGVVAMRVVRVVRLDSKPGQANRVFIWSVLSGSTHFNNDMPTVASKMWLITAILIG